MSNKHLNNLGDIGEATQLINDFKIVKKDYFTLKRQHRALIERDLEAVEDVYARSNKVLIDTEGSGNLLYLPIGQLMDRSRSAPSGDERNRAADSQVVGGESDGDRNTSRERRTRQ